MIKLEFNNRLTEFLKLNPQVKRLCIAYSGGLDSSVLFHLSQEFCKNYSEDTEKKLSICALHINHGLSFQADAWEEHCRLLSETYACEFVSHSVTINKKRSIEKQAREKRYQFFQECCNNEDVLLMAHHLNDQAETLLFRFFRGNSAKALMGIPVQRALHQSLNNCQAQILRPLLGLSKDQLTAYALQEQLTWVEDESNRDEKYARNFIRHQLLPSIRLHWPQVEKNLTRSARFFSETENLLNDLASLDLESLLNQDKSLLRWGDSLAILKLQRLSVERKKNLLRFWMKQKDVKLPPENRLLELIRFAEDLERESSGELRWKQEDFEVVFRVFEGQLFFHREYLSEAACQDTKWYFKSGLHFDCGGYSYRVESCLETTKHLLVLNVDIIDVRFRKGGERCQPAGRSHSQSLKKLFQEYRIPPWERDSAPLFYVGDELAAVANYWVCEGFQPSSEAKEAATYSIERFRK